jgi:hypothetical protein
MMGLNTCALALAFKENLGRPETSSACPVGSFCRPTDEYCAIQDHRPLIMFKISGTLLKWSRPTQPLVMSGTLWFALRS